MRRGIEGGGDLVWSRVLCTCIMSFRIGQFLLLFYFDGFDSLTSNPRIHFLDSYM